MGLSVGRLSKPRTLPNSYSGAPQSLPHRPRYTARQEGREGKGGRDVVAVCVCESVGQRHEKSLHLTPNKTATFCVVSPLRMDVAQTRLGILSLFDKRIVI